MTPKLPPRGYWEVGDIVLNGIYGARGYLAIHPKGGFLCVYYPPSLSGSTNPDLDYSNRIKPTDEFPNWFYCESEEEQHLMWELMKI